MDRLRCIRWGYTPPCATSIPLLPHRRRRWVSPRSFHQSPTNSVLRCDQREHRGGCRPSFPLDAFPPPRWLRRWCVRSALCSVLDNSTARLPGRPTALNATQKTGTPASPQAWRTTQSRKAFVVPSFHYTVQFVDGASRVRNGSRPHATDAL